MEQWNKKQKVHNAKLLKDEFLNGTIAEAGGIEDLKPSLGIINEKEMIMFTNHFHYEQDAHGGLSQIVHSVMYRSFDGGETWGKGKHTPFLGFEPSVTVIDGILFVQTHLLPNIFTTNKVCLGNIYRSEDKGETWTRTEITPEFLGDCPKDVENCPNRNFLKLPDGSIIIFVTCTMEDRMFAYRMRSVDKGLSWEIDKVRYADDTGWNHLIEAVTFITPSGRLMAIGRVDWSWLQGLDVPYKVKRDKNHEIDTSTAMLLIESHDDGLTWEAVRGLGYEAMMYPSIVYLDKERFILTYTMRDSRFKTPYPHMGVQAVLGREKSDGGFEIDFEHDIIILDDRTPECAPQTEGFGMTQLLPDGSLITPYSYREVLPEWEKSLTNGEYKTDGLFQEFYVRSGKARYGEKVDVSWWRNVSDTLKRLLTDQYAMVLRMIFFKTQVLKWRIEELDSNTQTGDK